MTGFPRVARSAATIAVLALAAPASATATTAVSITGDTVSVQGDATVSALTLSRTGATLTVADPTNKVTGAGGCTPAGPANAVTCPMGAIVSLDIKGGGGADVISNDAGSDLAPLVSLDGEAGDDQLNGGRGDEAFIDGPGNDQYTGGNGDDTFIDGLGNDTYAGQGGADTFVEGPGSDGYQGGTDSTGPQPQDTVDFSAGPPSIAVVFDGVANDGPAASATNNVMPDIEVLVGTVGNDQLTGQGGSGTLGKTLIGLEGADTFTGSDYDDVLIGGPGTDSLEGGPGKDSLDGGDGNDRLLGGTGDDTIDGGSGNDSINGDEGDDVVDDAFGNDSLAGGQGDDTAIIAPTSPNPAGSPLPIAVMVTLDDVANDGIATETKNVRSDVENVVTGDGNDRIFGSAGPNRLFSGAGNDVIDGLGGVDSVNAGAGDDRIQAVDFVADAINCSDGNDTAGGDSVDVYQACETVTKEPGVTPPDTVRPQVTISGLRTTVTRRSFRKGLRLTVTTNERASVVGELLAAVSPRGRIPFAASVGDVTIGAAKLGPGTGTRRLTLKPSARFAKRVRDKRLRLTVQLTVTDAAGNASVVRRKVRVR